MSFAIKEREGLKEKNTVRIFHQFSCPYSSFPLGLYPPPPALRDFHRKMSSFNTYLLTQRKTNKRKKVMLQTD